MDSKNNFFFNIDSINIDINFEGRADSLDDSILKDIPDLTTSDDIVNIIDKAMDLLSKITLSNEKAINILVEIQQKLLEFRVIIKEEGGYDEKNKDK